MPITHAFPKKELENRLNLVRKEMQKNNMLRLFGIAESDGAELFVSDHAKKKR